MFGRGGIYEDLKSILITVWYSVSEVFVHLPCPSSNLVYRSFESTLDIFEKNYILIIIQNFSHKLWSLSNKIMDQPTNKEAGQIKTLCNWMQLTTGCNMSLVQNVFWIWLQRWYLELSDTQKNCLKYHTNFDHIEISHIDLLRNSIFWFIRETLKLFK